MRQERAAAAAAYERAVYDQTQGLLDEAGLSPQGREVVRRLRELEVLRRLDLAGMAELGLNVVDRRKLEALCNSEAVQQATTPVLQHVVAEEVTMEEVMTEPERQRRGAERQRREAYAEQQRQVLERQEQQAQATQKARKRAECHKAIQEVLCCPCLAISRLWGARQMEAREPVIRAAYSW